MKTGITTLFFVVVALGFSCKTSKKALHDQSGTETLPYSVSKISTDTLFNSIQSIHLLFIPNKYLKDYRIELGYTDPQLKKTSQIALDNNAIAAINGGFFDVKNGGSVHYLEKGDRTISRTRKPGSEWSKPDSLANAALVWDKKGNLEIQPATGDRIYENSKKESAVLVSGPMLVQNSQPVRILNTAFNHTRHPRTCLCQTADSQVFIVIDGRSKTAQGMSLLETQKFLLGLGCIDALNLDGGGSSTLWTKEKGILNHPSDLIGERLVANAILLVKKQ
jgi:exopolysaccharide biosynthesis protein